jgi:hypothetical protein
VPYEKQQQLRDLISAARAHGDIVQVRIRLSDNGVLQVGNLELLDYEESPERGTPEESLERGTAPVEISVTLSLEMFTEYWRHALS